MKTTLKVKLIPSSGKPELKNFTYEKEKFDAISEFNEEELPLLKIRYKEVLVLDVKEK